jgi:hypothetical protein
VKLYIGLTGSVRFEVEGEQQELRSSTRSFQKLRLADKQVLAGPPESS